MTEDAGELSFDKLWEDTIIIALRDYQWHKAWTTVPRTPPASLLKLDGNAESAMGDVLTSEDDRFFLFEFKGDSANGGSEFSKPLVKLMQYVNRLPDDSVARRNFEALSRAAHHFVFPEFVGSITANGDDVEIRKARVATARYYDAAVNMSSSKYKLHNEEYITDIFKPNSMNGLGESYGLSASQMAAYLVVLANEYKKKGKQTQTDGSPQSDAAEGSEEDQTAASQAPIPMKALVMSDGGFYWPCTDMRNLNQVLALLQRQPHVALRAALVASDFSSLDRFSPADDSARNKRAGAAANTHGHAPASADMGASDLDDDDDMTPSPWRNKY